MSGTSFVVASTNPTKLPLQQRRKRGPRVRVFLVAALDAEKLPLQPRARGHEGHPARVAALDAEKLPLQRHPVWSMLAKLARLQPSMPRNYLCNRRRKRSEVTFTRVAALDAEKLPLQLGVPPEVLLPPVPQLHRPTSASYLCNFVRN